MALTINGTDGIETNTDTGKIKVGASDDLQIYHEGGHSYITNTEGKIHIEAKDGENAIRIKPDEGVELYYDNAKKVETTATGATVTGTCTATSFAGDGSALTGIQGSRTGRNLIVNGAMQVAQRGTTATTDGFGTVDRFQCLYDGTDEAPTQKWWALWDAGNDVGVFEKGFRYSYQIVNGNQTGGAGAGDSIAIFHQLESQVMANAGWDYTNSSSKITLSFWVKSSVAQNFYGYIRTIDGTQRAYAFETGALSANTWTKVTKTIPGDSSLQFDIDNGLGLQIVWYAYAGSNITTSGRALNTWINNDDANRVPDYGAAMDDWYSANDAKFEITGVQLELGDTATEFEWRSLNDELLRCYRYFYKAPGYNSHAMFSRANTALGASVNTPVPMRASPTSGPNNWVRVQNPGTDYVDSSGGSWTVGGSAPSVTQTGSMVFFQYGTITGVTNTANTVYGFLTYDLELNAEL